MDKKTWAFTIIFVLLGIATFILEAFTFFGVTPSAFIPYLADIKLCILISLAIIVVLIVVAVVNSHKAGIRQFLVKRAHESLERKIRKELETEATAKKLTFPHQQKNDVISKLANLVSSDIMNSSTPKEYSAQPMTDRVGDVYLGGHYLTIPFPTAMSLADKMTELSNDPQYRKKRR